jgi:hypothetical protein
LYRIEHLPPGAGYDQAAYGIDALSILDGARPIFLPTHLGREVLFSYLVALCSLLVPQLPTAVYVTSALVGVATVPAVYLAAHGMFYAEQGMLRQYGGLLSAFVVAIAHWHLSWSRLGMRVILVPLFLSLAVYLLWRGFRTRSRLAIAGSGLLLGLGMYTYQAFRIVPLLILLIYAYLAWSEGQAARRSVGDLATLSIVALVVFAPLGRYFVTHGGSATWAIREALVVDGGQGWADNARTLLGQVAKTLLAFALRGDQDPRVTIPGQPALDPFLSIAFVAGIGYSLFRLRRPAYPALLTWLGVMSVPAMLAGGGAVTKRALGALPAAAMLISTGCLAGWEGARRWVQERYPVQANYLSAAAAALLVVGLAYSAVHTYRTYFLRWSSDPALFTHFEVGAGAIGRYIRTLPPDERVYLSPVPSDHPSVRLYSDQREGLKTYHGRFCLVLPQSSTRNTTYIVVPGEDPRSLDLLPAYLPAGRIVDEGPRHLGQPYFQVYRAPAGSDVRAGPDHVQEAHWDEKVRLFGYDLREDPLTAGETLEVTLYYGAISEMTAEYTAFVQLLGPPNPATGGPLWAQDDSEPCRGIYPTSVWDTDELVIDRYALSVPSDMPPGDYQIVIGFYSWWTMERLPVVDTAGRVTGDHVVLTTLRVPASG